MHITAICPRCQSQYQVEPELRGKRMRCPNVICRAVFEVGADGATGIETAAPVVAPPPADSASVPPASAVAPPASGPPTALPSSPASEPSASALPADKPWEQAPPPVRQSSSVAASAPPAAPSGVDNTLDDFPVDAPARPPSAPAADAAVGVKAAPKRLGKSPGSSAGASSVTVPVLPSVAPRQARRRSLVAIVGMLLFLGGGLGIGLWLIGSRHAELEEERYREALNHYENEEFDKAVGLLQQLNVDYPKSQRRATYRFLAELADVRQAVAAPHEDSAKLLRTYEQLLQFLAMYQNDPLLKDRHGDVWRALHRVATQLVAEGERIGDKAFLRLGQRAWKEAGKYDPPPGTSVAEAEGALHKDIERIEQTLARQEERRRLSELLAAWTTEASAARVRQARRLVQLARFDDDPEFKEQLEQLIEAHRAQITFVAADKPAPPAPPAGEPDDMAYLAAVPPVGNVEAVPGPGVIVLALARGVLYALDSRTGEFVWARRVGVDVSEAPLRVAANGKLPERAFVVSSDTRTLAAVDVATGKTLWRHHLDGVCLAQPLLVEDRLLVPTLSGRIEEVDAATGAFLGAWQLDQPLPHGGAALPGTSLVYFAGAGECIYALDRSSGVCAAVLYIGHVAGELTVPPVVWTQRGAGESGGAGAQGWLALPRGDSEGNTRLDVWPLPWSQPDQGPLLGAGVAGRTGYAPWETAGKLALATDAGRLGLFGVRLPGNRDALLFPWLKDHPALAGGAPPGGARRGRALIAHADDASTWVLTQGELQRVDSTFTEKAGPGVTPRWADPPALGTPLHAAQTAVAEGRTILFLTTQAPDGADCYCSAVDAGTGRVLWRRQLGVVPVGPPVAWGKGVAFPDSGGLLMFDGNKLSGAKQGWRSAGTRLVADANPQAIAVREDGSLLRLAWSEQTLSWQSFSADKGARTADGSAMLPAPLAGAPALHGDYVVAALTNGVVVRIDLAGSTATSATGNSATATSGPDWRASGADEQAQAYVVALGQDVFAITDGSRGVQLVHWPEAKSWSKKGAATLAHRIVAPPAVLGALDMKETSKLRLVVADASDAVTMLDGASLDIARRWTLPGKISAGPLVCGPGIVCVLDGRRVTWLDPSAAMPRWEYPCAARLAGPPRWTDEKLLLADVSGAVTTLDPATGAATGAADGAGFSFRGDVAPAATPLVLGDGRIVIPLSDGTLAVR